MSEQINIKSCWNSGVPYYNFVTDSPSNYIAFFLTKKTWPVISLSWFADCLSELRL